jgi:hypothetical protein
VIAGKIRLIKVREQGRSVKGIADGIDLLKQALRHGEWDRCVEEQFGLSRSTANRCMRLASQEDRLTPYMTIREGYIAAGVINPGRVGTQSPPHSST